jgi:TrmH family RNA methyltransferase
MGGLFTLNVDIVKCEELPTLITRLRSLGRKIYATALTENAKKIGSFSLSAGDAFVIGNEGHGLSRAVIDASDEVALIPMTEESESLNAAAAAAICIWETVRSK